MLLGGVVAAFGMRRRDPRTALLLAGQFVLLMAFYASLVNWDAERSYGPRYLLPVIPLMVLPVAGRIARSRALQWLLVGSILLQAPGVLVDFSKVGASRVIGLRTEHERQWTWDASGFVINTRASLRAVPDNLRRLSAGERPPIAAGDASTRDFSDQFAFSLDFWWVYLFYLRMLSAPAALTCGAVSMGAAALLAWQLRVRTRSSALGFEPR